MKQTLLLLAMLCLTLPSFGSQTDTDFLDNTFLEATMSCETTSAGQDLADLKSVKMATSLNYQFLLVDMSFVDSAGKSKKVLYRVKVENTGLKSKPLTARIYGNGFGKDVLLTVTETDGKWSAKLEHFHPNCVNQKCGSAELKCDPI